jgi:hypothetical protein
MSAKIAIRASERGKAGSPAGRNWGMKVTKKTAALGLSTLLSQPWRIAWR